jgi:hypothetical protein
MSQQASVDAPSLQQAGQKEHVRATAVSSRDAVLTEIR